ncbi:MAG: PAS domain S-box protein [Syntrophobacteraceae bacterium]|nr:PAS domain S-box protein [Syntrophobacteraceae bacterium]
MFESLARMSPVGIFRTDLKGNCIYVNERWCEIAGLTVEAALGEGWVKAIHPGDRQRVFEEWYRSAQENRPFRSEYRFQRPDGLSTSVLGQASAELNPTGEVVGYVGTVTDITQQKKAEEALQEARDELEHRVQERTAELFGANEQLKKEMEERRQAEEKISETKAMLQTVFNGISEPLVMLEKSRAIRMLNEAACEYFQVSNPLDFTGKTCYELAGGRCAPCDNCVIRSAIGEGRSVTFERKGLLDPERSELVAVYPAEEAAHGFSGAIIHIRDITESRNLERHLLREDRLSSLGQLSGGIAHQIRNPLSGINIFVHILSDEKKFNRTSQELRILGEIMNNTSKIDGVIKRVLDFSRQSVNALDTLEVGALIEDAVELWRSRIRKDGIKLTVSLEENLSKVLGDPVEVRQVLNNLVQNAVEAMEKGGVLDITARRGVLSFDERRSAVIIEIRDSGRGIPLEQQRSVFNPFFTTKATGVGLGLAVAQRIVTRLGGTISFESTPEVGTTFCVELPTASRD